MSEHEDSMQSSERAERHAAETEPVREGGGGESEGFEEAERELIENASHESGRNSDPTHRAGDAEEQPADEESYGDADEEAKEDL